MKKKYLKNALGIAATGVVVGVGAELTTNAGAKAGLGVIGSGLKTVGGVASAGMVIDALGQLKPKKKKY